MADVLFQPSLKESVLSKFRGFATVRGLLVFWHKKFFVDSDNAGVDVADLEAARAWYGEKLGFTYSSTKVEEADLVLGYSEKEILFYFCRVVDGKRPNARPGHPPILFAKKVEDAHEYLVAGGVDVSAVQHDSGGNRFFRFRDLEGNEVEVCQNP
jgi:catechol 2,3-dioxygenase-like lactoylglutathione lyase family enzyme